ncbi:MAG: DUF928 domain-containing protein [Cyanobacteria bacterium P01_E01_bin.35]
MLSIASMIANSGILLAQTNEKTNNSQTQDVDISFEPPNRGTPQSSEGTGSRGDCLDKSSLPPLKSLGGKTNLKFTTSERPTFWVYIPYTRSEASYGEFSLQDGERDIYRTRFQLPTKPGIVGVSLPDTAVPLNVGRQYRWYFDINCSVSASSDYSATPASLTGIIERVNLSDNVARELNTTSNSLNQVASYAKHGIWYDALTELAQLRLQQPENPDFKQAWDKLLSDRYVNLAKISSEPILGILPSW